MRERESRTIALSGTIAAALVAGARRREDVAAYIWRPARRRSIEGSHPGEMGRCNAKLQTHGLAVYMWVSAADAVAFRLYIYYIYKVLRAPRGGDLDLKHGLSERERACLVGRLSSLRSA